MGKGGHAIIPSGSYTMEKGGQHIQWEKVVIPSFHVDHIQWKMLATSGLCW